jgi:hypothetical protein
MFCAFSAEKQRGDRKTQTHRPSYTKQPTLKKICANLRNLRIKNVCYQSLTAYGKFPGAAPRRRQRRGVKGPGEFMLNRGQW